jgi:hypothetical protein
MEINDSLTIHPPSPPAFVLANGDNSKAKNSSLAHLLKRIYVDNSMSTNNRDI